MKRCGSTRKVMHRTEESAIQAAIALNERPIAGQRPLNVYHCRDCQAWHVGHRPKHLPAPAGKAAIELQTAAPERERCEMACRTAASETVSTRTGDKRVCKRHAKRLRAAYAGSR